ncbi:hypothetical protein K4749_34365 [Streptomyces sp. TRM72054]|uniref:hypothetical protein n=1 Tax=Streptomyces sp. TRM72054 TaxID=2870562 RepID=UPI001C8CE894|nr:hypothetical protein [Streptomyces sp. TRM72054]MBX9398531.1 hypothetical protein [Streptomyces sp. TRM72054]
MAWDEWEQLKADALARQQDSMRLNSAGGSGAGGADGAGLRTNASGKSAAVRVLEEDIQPGTGKAGSHAEESSEVAVREFSGWATSSGLKDAHNEWELQVRNLKHRLDADKTALQQTKREFQYVDYDVKSQVSRIDPGLDTRREV